MHHRSPYKKAYIRQVKVLTSVEPFIVVLNCQYYSRSECRYIVFHCKHNLIHSYIQSLNPISKILKFRYLQIYMAQSQFKPFPRYQLATKAQSFPLKSSNTVSATIAHHVRSAQRLHMKLRLWFKFPTPWNNSDNSLLPGTQRCQMPGVCPGFLPSS